MNTAAGAGSAVDPAPAAQWHSSLIRIDGVSVGIRWCKAWPEALRSVRYYEALRPVAYSLGKGRKGTWARKVGEKVSERVRARKIDVMAIRGVPIGVWVGWIDPPRRCYRLLVLPEGVLDKVENAAEVMDVGLDLARAIGRERPGDVAGAGSFLVANFCTIIM